MGILSRAGDLVYTLRFLRLLTTPWENTTAFELGLIDNKGKTIKKASTPEEKSAHNAFHKLVFNIKKLLPGKRFGSYAAALYLIKEHNNIMENGETLTEEHLESKLNEYMSLVEDSQLSVDELFERAFEEDAPANSAGGGNIAGIGVGPDGEPGLSVSQQKKNRKKNTPVVKRFKDQVLLGSNTKG